MIAPTLVLAGRLSVLEQVMCSIVSGPFIVCIGEWEVQPQGVVLFKVHISGIDGGHSVLRRYKEFVLLDRELRKSKRKLPTLPPRSFGRCCVLSGFMERRRQGLSTFLAAALAFDPHCVNTPALRDFLGLPGLPTLRQLLCGDSDGGSTCAEDSGSEPNLQLSPSDLELYPIVETGLTEHESFALAPAPGGAQ